MKRWAALILVAACGAAPGPVRFSDTWPDKPGSFAAVNQRWTRHAILHRDYQQALEVYATLKSPEWRAARIEQTAELGDMPAAQRQQMVSDEQKAATDYVEVALVVTTWDRRENDLHRGARSVWKVALVDGAGNSVEPTTIQRDRRPKIVLKADYPDVGDFAEVYYARFPRRLDLSSAGASLQLRIWGPRGALKLTWQS